jgi:hypothetical protein
MVKVTEKTTVGILACANGIQFFLSYPVIDIIVISLTVNFGLLRRYF